MQLTCFLTSPTLPSFQWLTPTRLHVYPAEYPSCKGAVRWTCTDGSYLSLAEEPWVRSIYCGVRFWTTNVPSPPPLEGKQKTGE